jgi:hypothetical protein
MQRSFNRTVATFLSVATAGLAVAAGQAIAGTPSPDDGTTTGTALDSAGSLTQLFAPGEVDISTLGVSPTDLLGVGPNASTSTPGGNLIVAPPLSTNCPNAQYNSIQAAVNAAPSGAMIKVCAGTYIEQVTIPASKSDLTLYSVPDLQAVIKAPPLMTSPKAIVRVNGAQNITIRHFTITGPGGGPCDSLEYGVRVDGGGSATITDNHITQIEDMPFGGCQNGVAVRIGQMSLGETGSGTVVHNLIDQYQKGGTVVDNAGSSAEVAFNDIEGFGPTSATAQNGIQASRGADADIHQNVVSKNNYIPSTNDATGILLFQENNTGTSVHDNSTTLNDDGIYLSETTGTLISHNSSANNDVTGITADSSSSSNTISYNHASGNLIDCEDDSAGTGTAGTANFWIKDFGKTESRLGICKQTGP